LIFQICRMLRLYSYYRE